jgi:hypothetical protein
VGKDETGSEGVRPVKGAAWKDDWEVKELRSDKAYLSEAEAAAFAKMRAGHRRFLEEDHAAKRAARPVELIREMRAAADKMFSHGMPSFEKDKATFEHDFATRIRDMRSETLKVHPPFVLGPFFTPKVPPTVAPIPGAGELWWTQTASSCNLPGLTIDLSTDRVLLFGHIAYNRDPLFVGSCGFVEEYVLSPDRFPRTTKTSFEIDTMTRIFGIVGGSTAAWHWFWAADDKWCKCWMIVRKIAWLSTGEVLTTIENAFPTISLENASPFGQENTSRFEGHGGTLQFDADLSALAKAGTSILVSIEVRFDVQMEGESDLWIRRTPAPPSMENAMSFRTAPMVMGPR